MAAEERTPVPDLIRRLSDEAGRISFFQLVQRIRRSTGTGVLVGAAGPPDEEAFRFRPSTRLSFAPTDVDEFDIVRVESDGIHPSTTRYRVTVNFLGLYGPASPMPNHFSEEILWSGTEGERVRDFLDLFHHRLISFVYRAWERVRHPVAFESAVTDAASCRATCLVGLGTEGMREAVEGEVRGAGTLDSPPRGSGLLPFLRAAGLFSSQHRSAAGLEAALCDHFDGLPVRVESCVERRVTLGADQVLRLGSGRGRLGDDACLGQEVADIAGGFRVSLGPLPIDAYRRFLPGQEGLARLARLVRFYVSGLLDFDVELRLRPGDAPAARLASSIGQPPGQSQGQPHGPSQGQPLGASLGQSLGQPLGQMTWLLPAADQEGRVTVSPRAADPLYARPAA